MPDPMNPDDWSQQLKALFKSKPKPYGPQPAPAPGPLDEAASTAKSMAAKDYSTLSDIGSSAKDLYRRVSQGPSIPWNLDKTLQKGEEAAGEAARKIKGWYERATER